MKHSLPFYWLTLEDILLRKRFARNDRNGKGGAAIVMLHHVRDDNPVDISDSCRCTVREFEEFLEYVSANKEVISLDDLFSHAVLKQPDHSLVITFDDVPDNFFTTAYPILKCRNLPFTIYVAVGFIDRPGYISREQLEYLSKDPLCTIGSHTLSHPMLRKKGVDVRSEIYESKKILEGIIEKPVSHFAYPYGTPYAVSRSIVKAMEKSGVYRSAVSSLPGLINECSLKNKFFLPRIHSKLYMKNYKK